MVYCPSAGSLKRSRRPVARDRRAIDVPTGSSSPTKSGEPVLLKTIDRVSPCLPPNNQWFSLPVNWPCTVCPYSITLSGGGAVFGWHAAIRTAIRTSKSHRRLGISRVRGRKADTLTPNPSPASERGEKNLVWKSLARLRERDLG